MRRPPRLRAPTDVRPNAPQALERAAADGLELDDDDVTYFLGRETLIVGTPEMAQWREQLFVFMARKRGARRDVLRLPPERVVELGQVEL